MGATNFTTITDIASMAVVALVFVGFVWFAWRRIQELDGFQGGFSSQEQEFERELLKDIPGRRRATDNALPISPEVAEAIQRASSGAVQLPNAPIVDRRAARPPAAAGEQAPPMGRRASDAAVGTGALNRPRPDVAPIPPVAPLPPVAPMPAMAPTAPPRAVMERRAGDSAPEAESVEELAAKLQQLQIVTTREGAVALGMEPPGAIYRLKRGGLCALLPRMEGEEAMLHLARRFDVLFVVCRKGEVLVVDRYQTRLPQLLESPADPRKS